MKETKDELPIPVAQTVWYKNKTFWVNLITVAVLISTTYFGIAVPLELQTGLLALVNIILQSPSMAITRARAKYHNRSIRVHMRE